MVIVVSAVLTEDEAKAKALEDEAKALVVKFILVEFDVSSTAYQIHCSDNKGRHYFFFQVNGSPNFAIVGTYKVAKSDGAVSKV